MDTQEFLPFGKIDKRKLPFTPEHREKIKQALKGRTLNEKINWKKRISETLKKKYAIGELVSPMKGKKHTAKSLGKMGKCHKGQIAWNKGLTKENNEKIRLMTLKASQTKKGHTLVKTGEIGRKISESLKKCYAEKRFNFRSWNRGKTKETDERLKLCGLKISQARMGHPTSEEARKKMSETMKGLYSSGELVSWAKGKHFSGETRRRLSQALRGRHVSEESKLKNRLWHLGKKQSEETKRKRGLARLGHIVTTETREKIAKANRGRVLSAETRKKVSEGHMGQIAWNKGKPMAEEQRLKLKQARLKMVFPYKDTKIEVKMQNALAQKGIEFRKHEPITGQPDIFIPSHKLCVFVDGSFWHATPEKYPNEKIMYAGKTAKQIREHDAKINQKLYDAGFIVLRFGETEINSNISACVNTIEWAVSDST